MALHDWSQAEDSFVLSRTKPSDSKLIVTGMATLIGSALVSLVVGVGAGLGVVALGAALLAIVARREHRSERILIADGHIRLASSALIPGAWKEGTAIAVGDVRRVLLLEAPYARVGIELTAGSIVWATSLPLAAKRGERLTRAIAETVGASAHRWTGDAL